MMGVHHALTGSGTWLFLTSTSTLVPSLGVMPMEPSHVALGAVVTAGAALLPDADHPNATIAHSVPFVGKLATSVIGEASGGHRHGTHSGLSAVIVSALAAAFYLFGWADFSHGSVLSIASGVAAAGLLAFAVKVLRFVRGWTRAWMVGIGVAGLITWLAPEQWVWLPASIAVGWVVHMAGDFLTTGGLPLLWPLNPKPSRSWSANPFLNSLWSRGGYFAMPVLGNAGSMREWLLCVPLWLYVFFGLGVAGFEYIAALVA